MSCKVTGFGDHRARSFADLPEIDNVLGWFAGLTLDEAEQRLSALSFQLHGEAVPARGTAVSAQVPLRRWVALEVHDGSRRYCLHNGKWYRMDDNYLARIDDRVTEILGRAAPIVLPPWPSGEHEANYNVRAASDVSGITLDRKFISTPLHRRGIEPCDIYVHPGVLVCVKRGHSSADISHLLAQALVSADSLARDESARQAWTDRVNEESDGAVTDAEVRGIVLAIGRATQISVDSLFTFTKVNLVKQFDALRYVGVDVTVASIPEQ
jgi:uncharacterized protein (TIGR04141 family)